MSGENPHYRQGGNGAAPTRPLGPHQGHDHEGFPRRRARRLAQRPRPRRFLGALVRPVQAADADPGEGGAAGQGQGAARQDEHRRPPADRRPARHPVDPRGDRLQERPAARRLHGRAAGKPGRPPSSTASPVPSGPSDADRALEAAAEALAAKDFAGAAGLYSDSAAGGPRQPRGARRAGALLSSGSASSTQARGLLAGADPRAGEGRRHRQRARRARDRRAGGEPRLALRPGAAARAQPRTTTRRASTWRSR